jgi:opacity protein-like surface antigen
MTFKKTKLVLGIATATLTLAGAMASPEAFAHKKSSVQSRAVTVSGSDSRVSALQSQVNELANTVRALQAQLANNGGSSSKVQELDQWMASVKAAPIKVESKDNMVFFRGGFAHSNRDRNGVSIKSDVVPAVSQERADKNAWYMGAGFDFSLDDNLFGLADDTEVLAELMFDYKEFGTVKGNALADDKSVVTGGTLAGLSPNYTQTPVTTNPRQVTVNQFTLAASPKIKFLKGNDFRPWIIPMGLALQVVSPPTESITVLQPAMMFGVGADYKLWKSIYVGADARYHYGLGGDMDGVNTNGFTAGGYLGLGF